MLNLKTKFDIKIEYSNNKVYESISIYYLNQKAFIFRKEIK